MRKEFRPLVTIKYFLRPVTCCSGGG